MSLLSHSFKGKAVEMLSGLDLNSTVDYQVKDSDAVFKIGVMSSYLFARLSEEENQGNIEKAFRILQLSIKGWDNFSVPFSTEKQKLYGREIDVVPLSLL